ncbi:hypothetical protein ACFL59_07830 [Planctomycetota bacterium]
MKALQVSLCLLVIPLAVAVAEESPPFPTDEGVEDLLYCPDAKLLAGATHNGIVLWHASGGSAGTLSSGSVHTLVLRGKVVYSAGDLPPRIRAWDLTKRELVGEWVVGAQPDYFSISSKGPPLPRVSLALAPKSGKLAVAWEDTVSILSADLTVLRQFKRPTFKGSPWLSATEDGIDVTDRYYRLQSVFWIEDEQCAAAFTSRYMGAGGWSWDLRQEDPVSPVSVRGAEGVVAGENSRLLTGDSGVAATGNGHPCARKDAWIQDSHAPSGVDLRIVNDPKSSWALELSRWNNEGSAAWKQRFEFPENAYQCFEVVGDVVVLAGGQTVIGDRRLAIRGYDLRTGRELD